MLPAPALAVLEATAAGSPCCSTGDEHKNPAIADAAFRLGQQQMARRRRPRPTLGFRQVNGGTGAFAHTSPDPGSRTCPHTARRRTTDPTSPVNECCPWLVAHLEY